MTTKLDIFKQMAIYCQVPIETSFDTNTPTARTFDALYDSERESLLSRYNWRFAKRRVRLTEVEVEDNQKYPWPLAFTQPSDVIVSGNFRLYNGSNIPTRSFETGKRLTPISDISGTEQYDFYGFELRGNLILTEQAIVDMEYTADLPVEAFSPLAAKLLSLNISEIANGQLLGITSVSEMIRNQKELLRRDLNKELIPGDAVDTLRGRSQVDYFANVNRYF